MATGRFCCHLPPKDDNVDNPDPPETYAERHPAEWELVNASAGADPYDITDTCTEHLGDMVGDGRRYCIQAIPEEERLGAIEITMLAVDNATRDILEVRQIIDRSIFG